MATKSSVSVEFVKRFYYSIRNNSFVYRNIVNLKYKKKFKSFALELSPVQSRVLNEMNKNGIAIINIEELFDRKFFNELSNWIIDNENNLKAKSKKKFLFSYFGTDDRELLLDIKNPFIKFYTSDEILKIVVAYLKYIPQLFEVYVEKTIPVGDAPPSFSQNWHRDPEEKRTIKVFIYLSDVSSGSGPFTFLNGSTPTGKGRYRKLFPQKLPHGSYPSEVDVTDKISTDDLLVANGIKGSVIFCDTSGLHRGGYAKNQHRIMATGFFPSKKYSESSRFSVKGIEEVSSLALSPLAREVLGIKEIS